MSDNRPIGYDRYVKEGVRILRELDREAARMAALAAQSYVESESHEVADSGTKMPARRR